MSSELSRSACLRPEVVQSGGVVVENPEFAIRADIVFLAQHRYRIQLSGRAGLSVVSADNQVVPTGVFEDPGYIVVCPPGDQDVMVPERVVGELSVFDLVTTCRRVVDPRYPLGRIRMNPRRRVGNKSRTSLMSNMKQKTTLGARNKAKPLVRRVPGKYLKESQLTRLPLAICSATAITLCLDNHIRRRKLSVSSTSPAPALSSCRASWQLHRGRDSS